MNSGFGRRYAYKIVDKRGRLILKTGRRKVAESESRDVNQAANLIPSSTPSTGSASASTSASTSIEQPDYNIGADEFSSTQANPTHKELSYIEKCKKVSSKWDDVRKGMIDEMICTQYPSTFSCVCCDDGTEIPDILRCPDCGPNAYFCRTHIYQHHRITLYHNFERYNPEKQHFEPYHIIFNDKGYKSHSCGSTTRELITVIDINGQYVQEVAICNCEEIATTLVRNGLWPATPSKPQVAFPLRMMKILRILILETQMTIHGFCASLDQLNTTKKVNIQSSLKWESVLNFFYVFHSFTNLETISALPDASKCPVCPSDEDPEKRHCIAMDACFGEVRRKAAGHSYRKPLHKSRFFLAQSEVDKYLDRISNISSEVNPQGCCNLQAGTVIRSKNTTAKLDVKGIFGSVCYHDYPDMFLNLKHGERMAYLEFLLQKSKASNYVLYDIGCKFETFLKNRNVQHEYQLGIPIFHVFGHKMTCQILYSPRSLRGMGLYDGEGTERLWSFLRPFCNITKEMTPENRQDLLVEALLCYGARLSNSIALRLKNRLQKAFMLKDSSGKEFEEISSKLTGITYMVVKEWISKEQKEARNPLSKKTIINDWQEEYALKLKEYYQKMSDNIDDENLMQEVARLNMVLAKYEKRNKFSRWSENDPFYQSKLQDACVSARLLRLKVVRDESVQYHFFNTLGKKYSDGQSLANRINKTIVSASKKLNDAIRKYNDLPSIGQSIPPQVLRREDVISLDSPIWLHLNEAAASPNISVPPLLYRRLIDVVKIFERSTEEIEIVKGDLKRYAQRCKNIQNALLCEPELLSGTHSSRKSLATIAMHLQKKAEIEQEMDLIITVLKKMEHGEIVQELEALFQSESLEEEEEIDDDDEVN